MKNLRGAGMENEKQRFVPCHICGRPTTFVNSGRCRICLQVEALLDEYLQTEAGREFVEKALERARNGDDPSV